MYRVLRDAELPRDFVMLAQVSTLEAAIAVARLMSEDVIVSGDGCAAVVRKGESPRWIVGGAR